MKKMTLKRAKEILENTYIDALAAFAEYLDQFDEDDKYIELEKLDDKIFNKANEEWDCGEKWLQIYSGLMLVVD